MRLSGRVSAGMDISDGLSIDLYRLCLESGVAAELESDLIPVENGATLEEALHGGEDYELLVTAKPGARLPKGLLTRIGVITRGTPGAISMNGRPLDVRGFNHFSQAQR
jgi:thiamine-monophosphate kinase